ncbi:hypothetical protein SFC66_04270 [Terribacillus saccharophilus]|uniref:hypothetical protein n=1 Tax=Terribacillus saccharophilus TaxID=361277 RepID=UPI003981D6C9
MGNSLKSSRDYVVVFAIILLSTLLIFAFSKDKINYHLDELLTYSLSNSADYLNIESGKRYEDYEAFQNQFLTASENDRFNYEQVWTRQAEDVHPPFYYVLIHTISSFMPGEFSKYIGIAVNMIFNALIIVLLFKFAMLLTGNRKIAYITSLFWAINPGVISDMLFIRMYIMAMFFCLLITYVHIKRMQQVTARNYTFYLALFFASVAGFLTHYYVLIFTFFLCALYVLYLLVKKKFKELLLYVVTYILTLGAVLLIFPSIYNHLLGEGNRGEQSINNFMSLEGFVGNAKIFWRIISDNFFGGYLVYLLIGIVLLLITTLLPLKKYANKSVLGQSSVWQYVMLIVPCTLFGLLVVNIAVFTVERYIQPIFPLLILIFVTLLFHVVRLYTAKTISLIIGCVLLAVICITGYTKTTSFEYLMTPSAEALDIAEQYRDKDSVYLYEIPWQVVPSYEELSYLNSVTFYTPDKMEALVNDTDYDDFILYTNSGDESVVQSIVDQLPNVDTYTKLYHYEYNHAYYLE